MTGRVRRDRGGAGESGWRVAGLLVGVAAVGAVAADVRADATEGPAVFCCTGPPLLADALVPLGAQVGALTGRAGEVVFAVGVEPAALTAPAGADPGFGAEARPPLLRFVGTSSARAAAP